MFNRGLTSLSFGRMIRGGGSHRISSSTSGFRGLGARGRARCLVLRHPHLGWFSVGVRRLEEARATGLACRARTHASCVGRACALRGGRGFEVGSCRPLVGCIMVELRHAVVFVCMVVGGRGAPWCCQPVGCRSRLDPCMPGWFGIGRLACGLFLVGSLSLQQFGWCMVVLAALRSACLPLGLQPARAQPALAQPEVVIVVLAVRSGL